MKRSTVTLGLIVGGLFVGAASGGTLLAMALTLMGENPFITEPTGIYPFATGLGAVAGAVLAPLAGWSILRRVPLWKAALVIALGAIAGGVIGELVQPLDQLHDNYIPGILPGAVVGSVVAAVALALRFGRPTAAIAQPSNEEL